MSAVPSTTALAVPAPESTRQPCAHCGLEVPASLFVAEAEHQFCCAGCETVYGTLQAAGLGGDYYSLRDAFQDRRSAAVTRASERSYAAFDRDAFAEEFVHEDGPGLHRLDLLLEGVHCAACVWLVERLPMIDGAVIDARLKIRDARVTVRYRAGETSPARIAAALDSLGYPAHPPRAETAREVARAAERRHLMRMGVAAVAAGNAMLVAFALYSAGEGGIAADHEALFSWTGLGLGWLSILWPGRVFLRGALGALRTRTGSLDLPIAIALVVGAVAGTYNVATMTGEAYFDSLSVLVFLLLVGRYIQARQQRWAAESIDLTRALTPASARVVDPASGEVHEVTAGELRAGDLVEVRAGEPMPADGVIEHGRCSVDRALFSGESEPVPAAAGDEVFAGCQNLSGLVRVRIAGLGGESRVGRLMGLVEDGLRSKPPIERFTDRIAGVFVGVVCLLAALTFTYWSFAAPGFKAAIDNTVALLIVACPCALGLATPLSLAVAVGRAAREGVLVKDAAVLEKLSRGGALVLDKTGTITAGRARVVGWAGDEDVRAAVAAIEAHSNHPVARALRAELEPFALPGVRAAEVDERLDGGIAGTFRGRRLRIGSLAHLERRGARLGAPLRAAVDAAHGRGETVVGVLDEGPGEVVAIACLADAERADAREAIDELRALGFTPEVLSGDAAAAVGRVAAAVGIDAHTASAEPEDKLARIRALQGSGAAVVMVGDGVNDAAALAAADVGVAVKGGAEISLAAADVFASREGLMPLASLVRLSRRTMTTIRGNLAVSLVYNVAGVTLAALGYMSPLAAAILMPLSSVTVLTFALALFGRGSGAKHPPAAPRPESGRSVDPPAPLQSPLATPCP